MTIMSIFLVIGLLIVIAMVIGLIVALFNRK